MSGDLFDLKNFFVLGNYQAAINKGNSIKENKLKEQEVIEKDVYIFRSYIAQGNYQLVINEVNNSSPIQLQAIKLLAVFLSKEENREGALTQLKQWLNDGTSGNNPTLQLVAATIYYHLQQYEDALRSVLQSNSLEGLGLLVQIYLRINRLDQAEKELKTMQQNDDDAIITQLASAWVSIAAGGDRIQDASQTFQHLIDRYDPTPLLLNGLGVCALHSKQYDEAEQHFLQALEKNPSDADAIVNLITAYQHQGRAPEIVNRQINQLRTIAPKHPHLLALQKLDDDFDNLAERFSLPA